MNEKLCGRALKKPVEIDWFLWDDSTTTFHKFSMWLEHFGKRLDEVLEITAKDKVKIKTLEGSSYELPNGYIVIRGVEGEFYPCEPKIFNKTYNIKQ